MPESWERTDGVVTIRPPQPGDSPRLIAGRDTEFHRFLGPGSDEPDPAACITLGGDVVGWVDHDAERYWLLPGEVNLGLVPLQERARQGALERAVDMHGGRIERRLERASDHLARVGDLVRRHHAREVGVSAMGESTSASQA